MTGREILALPMVSLEAGWGATFARPLTLPRKPLLSLAVAASLCNECNASVWRTVRERSGLPGKVRHLAKVSFLPSCREATELCFYPEPSASHIHILFYFHTHHQTSPAARRTTILGRRIFHQWRGTEDRGAPTGPPCLSVCISAPTSLPGEIPTQKQDIDKKPHVGGRSAASRVLWVLRVLCFAVRSVKISANSDGFGSRTVTLQPFLLNHELTHNRLHPTLCIALQTVSYLGWAVTAGWTKKEKRK